ncbi:MAG: pyruvate kinase [Phycisphaerales bacterium]
MPETHPIPNFAKIVATIGPASDSREQVRRLIEAGVGVFRFNFSHGDLAKHGERLATVRSVAAEMGVFVSCLGDLQGPKIRVGKIPAGVGTASASGGGSIEVVPGQDVVLSRAADVCSVRQGPSGPEAVLSLTYKKLVEEVLPGHKVLINDGVIRMLAISRDGEDELRCRVVVGGLITSGKGINVPQSSLTAPAITDRDWECAEWAAKQDMDYLALSFVRTADEIYLLKKRVEEMVPGAWIPVVSKIEMPQAVANLASIVEASDAIMVARGDLGVEMDIARVPVVQKQIIAASNEYGKPCIVATQMLETMIENSSPTRAEASDVANAIFDGADAVMLSAETATGKHPVLVVETMSRIVAAAETRMKELPGNSGAPLRLNAGHRATAALAHGAWEVARDMGATAVACWSQNGGTARYLSQNNFHVPILAFTSSVQTARRMALLRGVIPVLSEPPASGMLTDWNAMVDRELVKRGLVKQGDPIVLLAGRPLGRAKATNTLAIGKVGEAGSGFGGS